MKIPAQAYLYIYIYISICIQRAAFSNSWGCILHQKPINTRTIAGPMSPSLDCPAIGSAISLSVFWKTLGSLFFSQHPRLQQNAFSSVNFVASSAFKPAVDIEQSLGSIEMVSVDPEKLLSTCCLDVYCLLACKDSSIGKEVPCNMCVEM